MYTLQGEVWWHMAKLPCTLAAGPQIATSCEMRGNFDQMSSYFSLQLVHLLNRHFLISLGSNFLCHSNGVLHYSIEVLCGNLIWHLLVILFSNWTLYKLDTTVSYMKHIAWTMLYSVTQNKAYLTDISHRRAEESDWWHLIKVPTAFTAGRDLGTSCEIAWELWPDAIRLLSAACTPTI